MESDIMIYTVRMPSIAAWPPGDIILKLFYSKEEAESYISTYPNIFARPFLKIKEEKLVVQETD